MTIALMQVGRSKRGKGHLKTIEAGGMPRLADLHFPIGGHRFRPCLEDILQMIWFEFGIDVRDTALGALGEGRVRFRERQLAAAVGDDPDIAALELRRLGYSVESPATPVVRRIERLTAL